jgi:hypothetical protein
LEEHNDGTLLMYSVNASVGGKLAQIGQRLIDTAANKLADQFFGKFNEILSQGDDSQRNDEIVVDNSEGFSPKVWISTLAILSILSIVLWYFLGQI